MGDASEEGAAGTWESPGQPGGSGPRSRGGQALRNASIEKAKGGEALKETAKAARGPGSQGQQGGVEQQCQMPPGGPESSASSRIRSCGFRPRKANTLLLSPLRSLP